MRLLITLSSLLIACGGSEATTTTSDATDAGDGADAATASDASDGTDSAITDGTDGTDGSGEPVANGQACAESADCISDRCSAGICIDTASRPAGDPCDHNDDCVSGLICNYGQGHVCAPPSKGGEACGHATDCVTGFTCPAFGVNQTCECQSVCGDGLSCGAAGCVEDGTLVEGAACAHNSNCVAGLVCNYGKGHICTAASAVGELCDNETDCVFGLACDQEARACEEPCLSGDECQPGELCGCYGVLCTGRLRVCHDGGAEGATCSVLEDSCSTGTGCTSGGACAALSPLGGSCTNDHQCDFALKCDGSKCQPAGAAGDACSTQVPPRADCAAGLFCNPEGECEARGVEGAACHCPLGKTSDAGNSAYVSTCGAFARAYGSACASGLTCVEGDDETSTCKDL